MSPSGPSNSPAGGSGWAPAAGSWRTRWTTTNSGNACSRRARSSGRGRQPPGPRAWGGQPGRRPAVLRPRPAAGVFTSLLVDRARRAISPATSRGWASAPGSSTASTCHRPCTTTWPPAWPPRPSGRLRITAQPVGGQLRVSVAVVPLDSQPATIKLRPAVVPGGLGEHKWHDRRLIAELTRQRLPDQTSSCSSRTPAARYSRPTGPASSPS